MIHDLLISCLNLNVDSLPIQELIDSNSGTINIHPSEKKFLKDIILIVNNIREVTRFSEIYGGDFHDNNADSFPNCERNENITKGPYLKAFANAIQDVLEEYVNNIAYLERCFLQNPNQSLLFFFQKIQIYEPLALFLRKTVRSIGSQKVYGCSTIMRCLSQSALKSDVLVDRAIKTLKSAVNLVFLKQLLHWTLYAKVDINGEFFIQFQQAKNLSVTMESNIFTNTSSENYPKETFLDTETYADIWGYEVCFDYLPNFLTLSWAEKVLFIGQTVLMFNQKTNATNSCTSIKNAHFENNLSSLLWNDKEQIYFAKIQELEKDPEPNVIHFECVINEIKTYVTNRLSEIAIKQGDLINQLKLIKDYYLLGRGELFLEFIRQAFKNSVIVNNENKLKHFVKSFELAAYNVGVSEESGNFSLSFNEVSYRGDDELSYSDTFQTLQLNYKINWPLHLLFSPKIIARYNTLFTFLLRIKKIQYDLHKIWYQYNCLAKIDGKKNWKILMLKNQLMFFIDNLYYYIQVVVLESQFTILINTILNKADFEQVQKAHTVFQVNILSQCFLLTEEDLKEIKESRCEVSQHNNSVCSTLHDVFLICEDFSSTEDLTKGGVINDIESRFNRSMQQLTSLLINIESLPNTTPLTQLLMLLDYNYWFSGKMIKKKTK